jgi:molecular chaperone DnaK (HSP70)
MNARFSLGIDLGTSNSAIAADNFESDEASIVEITQILRPNQIGESSILPSALYLPHPDEFPTDAFRLPWANDSRTAIIGHFAREHGALMPDRLVTSAKSWLSSYHVDPRRPVLPWKSDISEPKLSAFDCSRLYLEHLKEGFLYAEQLQGRSWNLSEGKIVLTVPASFDEAARNLTAEAAEAAGLGKVTLLEEPQAAFYAWTARAAGSWRNQVNSGDIILVCDVGGGTADFSLIAISGKDGNLQLERISVGEHILLGGDNMDLALAYTLQAQLESTGKSLDAWQFLALTHAASRAKVDLFNDESVAQAPISVPSRGSSLFAKTLSTILDRHTLEQVVLDGFFPITEVTDLPDARRSSGLQEFGLPYASDPIVSKHLARFLTRSLANVKASASLKALVGVGAEALDYLRPTAVLFNGGVFNAAPIRQRVLEILASWNGGQPVRELEGFQPDLAVAKGAALYGRHRATGKGIRIKAGTARSYYVGLESSMPAIPGFKPPIKALCVVPQGMEEGSALLIAEKDFGLMTGQPAEFRFFASEVRSGDTPGQVIPNAESELEETSRLEVTLPTIEGLPEGQPIPVQMNPVVTELGNLELWMKHTGSDRRWKVEFQVRME